MNDKNVLANKASLESALNDVASELNVEGDPKKRALLKLQQISLEYELDKLLKENPNGNLQNLYKPHVGRNG